jgi:4a-hydroxytetrahydrobiopterin dehydratase
VSVVVGSVVTDLDRWPRPDAQWELGRLGARPLAVRSLGARLSKERDAMPVPVRPDDFHATPGVEDWRYVFGGVAALFRTGSFATGVALVDRIGRLADAANHHPDVDLRYPTVGVRLATHEIGDVSDLDVALARQISDAARELGITADPAVAQTVQLTIDTLDVAAVRPFWQAVLAFDPVGDDELADPLGRWPAVWFQRTQTPRTERNRVHVDVCVAPEVAQARVEAALAAGGRLVSDEFAPHWWTLADAEGNEVDVATTAGR